MAPDPETFRSTCTIQRRYDRIRGGRTHLTSCIMSSHLIAFLIQVSSSNYPFWNETVLRPLQCIAVALENYFSHSLQSLVPMRIHSRTKYEYGHETLQGMGKIIFQRNCNTLYSALQLHWKIIFPFLAKSRAHTHTLYGSVCAWERDFARNGKIIFQCNYNTL